MSEDFRRRLNREFWIFLRSQGFPRMTDEALMAEADRVSAEAPQKRMSDRHWIYYSGGQHSDDVALVRLLAEMLGLKEGVEWDWTLESDNYHYLIAYSAHPRVKKLLRMLHLYHETSMIRLQAFTRVKGDVEVDEDELQRIFREEWQQLERTKESPFLKEKQNALFDPSGVFALVSRSNITVDLENDYIKFRDDEFVDWNRKNMKLQRWGYNLEVVNNALLAIGDFNFDRKRLVFYVPRRLAPLLIMVTSELWLTVAPCIENLEEASKE